MNWRKIFMSTGMFTPKGLLLRAVVLAAAYGIAHAAGGREYTSILSGTTPGSGPHTIAPVILGVVYVGLHFAFVLGAPVLVIAGILLGAVQRWPGRQREVE